MRVLLLGTTGYHPTDDRQTACVLLPDLGIAFDAGTGMYRVGRHLTTETLDVFISHAHLDHVVGLTYFFTLLYEKDVKRLTVHGDVTKLAAVRDNLFNEQFFPVKPVFHWEAVQPEMRLDSGPVLKSFPLIHPGGSLGYRMEHAGKSLAYVTDTTARVDAAYVEQIRGVDMLLHECNFPNGQDELAVKTGHSCLDDVARVAAAAQVKRLVLIHFDPVLEVPAAQIEAARKIFPSIEPGRDNMELDL
jgi:ribonuclease BN (tRNA processing enzyme)